MGLRTAEYRRICVLSLLERRENSRLGRERRGVANNAYTTALSIGFVSINTFNSLFVFLDLDIICMLSLTSVGAFGCFNIVTIENGKFEL